MTAHWRRPPGRMTRQKRGPCTIDLNCTPHTDTLSAQPRLPVLPRFPPKSSTGRTIVNSRRCDFATRYRAPAATDQHPPSNAGTIFPVKTSNPTKTPWGRHSCLPKKFDRQECLPHARKKTVWTAHRLHTYNSVQPPARRGNTVSRIARMGLL